MKFPKVELPMWLQSLLRKVRDNWKPMALAFAYCFCVTVVYVLFKDIVHYYMTEYLFKHLPKFVGAFLLVAFVSYVVYMTYKAGYNDGSDEERRSYDQGYRAGYPEGYWRGYRRGYWEGFSDALRAIISRLQK